MICGTAADCSVEFRGAFKPRRRAIRPAYPPRRSSIHARRHTKTSLGGFTRFSFTVPGQRRPQRCAYASGLWNSFIPTSMQKAPHPQHLSICFTDSKTRNKNFERLARLAL